MNAAQHLEHHLGPIDRGWSSGALPGIQVCLFRNRPVAGVITLATLGLSNTVLTMKEGRKVREELLFALREEGEPQEFARLLTHVAERLVTTGQALLRGDLVPLDEQYAVNSRFIALYASMPVVFPGGLATLIESSPPTVFVWLVPLLAREATFVELHGWSEFEDRLEAADPDLFDVGRDSIV